MEALPRAIAAMSEPMVSHDCVAFWLLSQAVARERKVVQSGQGADEVLGGYYWYPPLLDAPGSGWTPTRRSSSTATTRGVRELTGAAAGDDVSRAFAAEWFERAGAATPVDRALRLDAEVMLVDDPVKRVDNMTMAHGLEARTPFLDHELVELAARMPARAQARRRRQGRPQGREPRRRARRGDRPREGLLPRAGALAPRGPVLGWSATRCWRRRATAACSAATWSRRCSPTPTPTARTSTATSRQGTQFSREDRQRYREKVRRNLDVFERMLREARFDAERRSIGLEIELNLTDEAGDPAMANAEVLENIADDAFVTELGQFNIEINIQPQLLDGRVFDASRSRSAARSTRPRTRRARSART